MMEMTIYRWQGMIHSCWMEPFRTSGGTHAVMEGIVVTTEGNIPCLKKSGCNMEGIVSWWQWEAFSDDRELLSCIWGNHSLMAAGPMLQWKKSLCDFGGVILWRTCSLRLEGIFPWWPREYFAYVGVNHLLMMGGISPYLVWTHIPAEGIMVWLWRESFPVWRCHLIVMEGTFHYGGETGGLRNGHPVWSNAAGCLISSITATASSPVWCILLSISMSAQWPLYLSAL